MGGCPNLASFFSAQNSVVVFGSCSGFFGFLGFTVARPVLAMTSAAAASIGEEDVVGSTSRWLVVFEKSRNDVGRIDGVVTICNAKPCRKQRAMGRATW